MGGQPYSALVGGQPWWVMSLGGWSALVGDEPWWVVSLVGDEP